MTEAKKYTLENTPEKYRQTYAPICCVERTVEVEVEKTDEAGVTTVVKEPKVIAPTHAGTITLVCPTYDERSDLMHNSDFKADASESKEEQREKAMKLVTHGDWLQKIIRRSDAYVLEVKIKRLRDGFVFDCLEDLRRDHAMASTLQEMALMLTTKGSVGNFETK